MTHVRIVPWSQLQTVCSSVCLLLKFRGDELNSPAAQRGGAGGLLIQLLHRCVHSSNTRPPHFLNTHTTTQSRAPSTSPTTQKEQENTHKKKKEKKRKHTGASQSRVESGVLIQLRCDFFSGKHCEKKNHFTRRVGGEKELWRHN